MLMTCLFSLAIFITLVHRISNIKFNYKSLPSVLYKNWDTNTEARRGKTKDYDFGIKDCHIYCHSHRMYLEGSNSINYPWYIPLDCPKSVLAPEDMKIF
mmetsp:Transcript_20509/g.31215  ORF Transcript_20509/g.31215 Transcript_20509/m.31215 type:complete len:99 (+) Transcript_20509:270-566(+)